MIVIKKVKERHEERLHLIEWNEFYIPNQSNEKAAWKNRMVKPRKQ